MVIRGDGNVGIGVTAPVRRLEVVATAAGAHPIATAWELHSDLAFKTNIENLNYGLAEVLRLQPRSFNLTIDGSPSVGFIAQEMRDVIPELVSGEEGQMGISYSLLTAVLTRAIQEQQKQIDALSSGIGISTEGTLTQNGAPVENQPLGTLFVERVRGVLTHLGLTIENGIARARELFAERITAGEVRVEKLCVGDVCVDENQLRELLQRAAPTSASNVSPAPSPEQILEPNPDSKPAPTPEPDPGSPPTSKPAPTSDPTPESAPTPEHPPVTESATP